MAIRFVSTILTILAVAYVGVTEMRKENQKKVVVPSSTPPNPTTHRSLGDCRITANKSSYSHSDTINVDFQVTFAPDIRDRIYVKSFSGGSIRLGPLYTCCLCNTSRGCRSVFEGRKTFTIEASSLGPGRYYLTIERDGLSFSLARSSAFRVHPLSPPSGSPPVAAPPVVAQSDPSSAIESEEVVTSMSSVFDACFDGACQPQLYGDELCGNLDFCFGLSQAHPSSSFSSCCEDVPSCYATRQVQENMKLVERVSKADFSFSLFAILMTALKLNSDLVPMAAVSIAFIEFLDFCFSAGVVAAVNRGDLPGFTQDVVDAHCFTNVGNEQLLSDFKSEFESFRSVAYGEIFASFVAIAMHMLQLANHETNADMSTMYAFLGFIMDMIELVLAGIGLFKFLLPAIDGFELLFESMISPVDMSSVEVGDPVPCVLSMCS